MLKWLGILIGTLRSVLKSRRDLALENLAQRQQVAVLKQAHPRPKLSDGDRFFWSLVSRFWSGWRDMLHVVRPDTVVRWHRQGFRYYWRWKSRRPGRPKMDREVIKLIRRLSGRDVNCFRPVDPMRRRDT
jgi:putative transposase